jgi:hypothetical protein
MGGAHLAERARSSPHSRKDTTSVKRESVRERAPAVAIATWFRSQSAVLPSMSVKRKEPVPHGKLGRSVMLPRMPSGLTARQHMVFAICRRPNCVK